MGFLDTLKKLNVVRAGTVSATYKNAADRPLGLDDDMSAGGTGSTNRQTATKTPVPTPLKSVCPSRNFLIASVVLGVIFIFLASTTTIAWLVILIWLIWVIYIGLTYSGKMSLLFSFSLTITLIVVCVVSLLLIFLTQRNSSDTDKSSESSSAKALTSEECKPYYDKYNDKVLKLSSDGLQGTVGIKIDMTEGCKLKGWYNVILSQNLPQNPYSRDVGPSYHYNIMLRPQDQQERTKYDGYGTLSPAFKNVTNLPDPFAEGQERSDLYSQGVQATETRYFYWGCSIDTDFSEMRYQQIFDDSKLEIVDGLPFIEEKTETDGTYSYGVNDERAAESGNIVKSYILTIEE